ncbi:MAG: PP2C family protein-serine/threonine phosphatase [Acidobacteriia bacterium]|nr:PP2C family protein-serine/threonine phosphatase [Terriglobia bacterium]
MTPALIDRALQVLLGFKSSAWIETATTALLFLSPLAFAYAVVKHRVLEIPVLLKRSARYLLVQRGFTFLLSLVSIGLMLMFAFAFSGRLQAAGEAAEPTGISLGAVIGTALLWGGSQVHRRVSGRIDRAFFRSAYNARVILEELAEDTRTATDRAALARLLEQHIREALQPRSLAIFLEQGENTLALAAGEAPRGSETIPIRLPELLDPALERDTLAAFQPEYLVPIAGRNGRLLGLVILGLRLSEEPYSGDDKRLLASAAGQAGTALENIRLAEDIAARIEGERRTAREMEIAREVQARLFPQSCPSLPTLDCAAQCIQARSVGGDYYDFVDLGGGKTGFVLADVSGKGVHAALLMAHLQAQLRSHCGVAPLDPAALLKAVNRGLWQSTAAQHYATLFFAVYDEGSRRLQYINCGHNPPVWLRPGAPAQRLEPTATVIGAFEQWTGAVREVQLAPGDLLVVFSDGVTEAARGEEEFGEARLLDVLRANRDRAAGEILDAVLAAVQQFSAGAQSDDLTLLIARAK